jgi:hypothetical protein
MLNLLSVREERADLIVVAHLMTVVQSHIQLQISFLIAICKYLRS